MVFDIYRTICILLLAACVSAQFQFFDNFFGGQQQQKQHQRQNVASDSKWYRETWQQSPCSNYLCPDTLACVAFPHHCPCAFPDVEEKVELADGKAICASRGGFKEGETSRKIELARKGLL